MLNLLKTNALNILLICILLLLSVLFIKINFHDLLMGGDELRTTYVAKEIANRGKVYYTDPNNNTYNTNIFVKTGFLINNNKIIYPIGFTINSLILVPLLSVTQNSALVFNIFALICYILSFLVINQIFRKLGLSTTLSILGSIIFSVTNYNLAMYVSYFPDFVLSLLFLVFIYVIISYEKTKNEKYLYLIPLISSFLLAYKITMYPILFTFLPLYFIFLIKRKQLTRKIIATLVIIFMILFPFFNFPMLQSTIIGNPYPELTFDNDLSESGTGTINQNQNEASLVFKISVVSSRFYNNFLLPKGNGEYLLFHLGNSFYFFALNNVIVLIGFFFSIYLFRINKWLFAGVFLVFITSFLLWGNMSYYGGAKPSLLGNLRNTYIRYMLPITILFYILGFFYLSKFVRKQYILIILLIVVLTKTYISLANDYPFLQYSPINKVGFVSDYINEKQSIINLRLPQDSLFLSATYDDYDLSYYFDNYANFKLLAKNPVGMEITLNRLVNDYNRKVYFLFPKSDSRFNPISQKELDNLYLYIKKTFSSEVIFEDHYKQLLVLSPK